MSIDAEMTIDERRKYLRKVQKRYWPASRLERGRLLDEMEARKALYEELRRKSARTCEGLAESRDQLADRIARQQAAASGCPAVAVRPRPRPGRAGRRRRRHGAS